MIAAQKPRPNVLRSSLFALALIAGVGWPAQAAVQVVDCVAGPFFDIGSAVDAASPGDTVLVEPCAEAYPPFEVFEKSDLHIVGNGNASVIPVGLPGRDFRPLAVVADEPDQISFACARISFSDKITLTNLRFDRCGFHAVNIDESSDVKILANRFEESFETVRDSTASGSQITGNLFVGGAFAVFVDGDDALVSQNVILDNVGSAISLLSPHATGNQVVANVIVRSRTEAIFVAGDGARIERNVCRDIEGGLGDIVLSNNSEGNIVVGNVIDGEIFDEGADNILVGNQ